MVRALHPDELILVWKHPVTRLRYAIGRLWRCAQGFGFCYVHDRRGIKEALGVGFRAFDAFPDISKTYSSSRLFPMFARRLPAKWRHARLRSIGIDPEDPMEYFRRTGGRLVTDTLEFLEPIRQDEDAGLTSTVNFPVAGWRYYDGESVIHALRVTDRVILELEPGNPIDPGAVRVLIGETHVGYVPSIYAWYVDEAVAQGAYEARVLRIGPAHDPQNRLWLSVRGQALFGLSGDLTEDLRKQEALLYT